MSGLDPGAGEPFGSAIRATGLSRCDNSTTAAWTTRSSALARHDVVRPVARLRPFAVLK